MLQMLVFVAKIRSGPGWLHSALVRARPPHQSGEFKKNGENAYKESEKKESRFFQSGFSFPGRKFCTNSGRRASKIIPCNQVYFGRLLLYVSLSFSLVRISFRPRQQAALTDEPRQRPLGTQQVSMQLCKCVRAISYYREALLEARLSFKSDFSIAHFKAVNKERGRGACEH